MPKTATKSVKQPLSTLNADQIAFFQGLFEGSTDAVQVDDIDGRVVFANGSWLSLYQVDADDALGAKWAQLVKGRLCQGENLSRSWSSCKKGKSIQGAVGLKTDGDGQMQVSYSRTPLRGENGEVVAVLSIFRPEMLKAGNEEIAEAVHDINNTFTAIIAGAQLIERQNSEIAGLSSKADLIQRSAKRGLELLSRLGAADANLRR